MRPQKKAPKISVFCQTAFEEGITRPVDLKREYEARYVKVKPKTLECYSMALKRLGLTKEVRDEQQSKVERKQNSIDLLEYPKVKSYILNSSVDGVTQGQVTTQLANFRKLWNIMGCTDPETWTEDAIMQKILEKYPMTVKESGASAFEFPAMIKSLLSPFNTMYQGILRKNWSANLCVHKAGELKDFFNFLECEEFLSNLTDTQALSVEGWQAAFRTHINQGCREGHEGNTGILGMLWEDINFQTKRASLREKGHRGNAGERWNNVPLDMFAWLHGWEWLMKWWNQQGQPRKGKVFPIKYTTYNEMFHKTRHRCKSRIREDIDSMRLHILRRTHAQYAQRLGLRIEFICGDAPNGRFGVGWKDPKILVKFYLTAETEDIDPTELQFMQTHPEYGFVLKQMEKTNNEIKQLLGVIS